MSRSDSGTSTVGDLSIVVMQGHSGGNSLSASNMNLTVTGSASLNSQQLSQSNGVLTFQSAPSLSNSSSLSVSNGELVLANGGTVNGSSLQLTASKFKPAGSVSVTNGGTFALNGASSVVLKGDTTLNQSGSVSWPELDLGG